MEAEDFRKGIYMFTSEQYLARAVEYGDLAKTTIGSNERRDFQELEQRFFQELEQRFTVLEVLADNEQLLADESNRSAVDVRVFMQNDVQQ
jgi:hypothetical protein